MSSELTWKAVDMHLFFFNDVAIGAINSEQRCLTHGAKLWNRHVKIMVHYSTCLQDACAARNLN